MSEPTPIPPHDHLKQYAIGAAIGAASAAAVEIVKAWLMANKRASYCTCEEDDE